MIRQALGTLSPIVYFENSRGDIALPPHSETARYYWEKARDANGQTWRDRGYEYREAGTLAEVDKLQKRLVEQSKRELEEIARRDELSSEELWQRVGSNLRQRMVSSSTSAFEKEFIRLYLEVREEKRSRHRQRWLERTMFLEAREMDSGYHPEDRL